MKPRITTVITDLDNTLWDWVEIWYRPFNAMLDRLIERSGVPRERLEQEIRRIHQKYGTSEYAFLIEELPCLQEKHPGAELTAVYGDAIEAYRAERNLTLRLYSGVENTLLHLHQTGCLLVGYTESTAYYTRYRLRKTGVDAMLDFLYSPEDHELPSSPEDIRLYPKEKYELSCTEHRHTPHGELKPNPHILEKILHDIGSSPQETLYVGDSKMKDIAMAQSVGALDAWAKYGMAQHTDAYALLRRVSHWTDQAVEAEKMLLIRDEVTPSITLESFSDIRNVADFEPHRSRAV